MDTAMCLTTSKVSNAKTSTQLLILKHARLWAIETSGYLIRISSQSYAIVVVMESHAGDLLHAGHTSAPSSDQDHPSVFHGPVAYLDISDLKRGDLNALGPSSTDKKEPGATGQLRCRAWAVTIQPQRLWGFALQRYIPLEDIADDQMSKKMKTSTYTAENALVAMIQRRGP